MQRAPQASPPLAWRPQGGVAPEASSFILELRATASPSSAGLSGSIHLVSTEASSPYLVRRNSYAINGQISSFAADIGFRASRGSPVK